MKQKRYKKINCAEQNATKQKQKAKAKNKKQKAKSKKQMQRQMQKHERVGFKSRLSVLTLLSNFFAEVLLGGAGDPNGEGE